MDVGCTHPYTIIIPSPPLPPIQCPVECLPPRSADKDIYLNHPQFIHCGGSSLDLLWTNLTNVLHIIFYLNRWKLEEFVNLPKINLLKTKPLCFKPLCFQSLHPLRKVDAAKFYGSKSLLHKRHAEDSEGLPENMYPTIPSQTTMSATTKKF